jgi:thioredoxin 1
MVERMIITVVIAAGLALFWLGWQLYKSRLLRQMQPGVASGKPTLLYFTGEYCAVCKFQQAPIVEQLAAAFADQLIVQRYDVADRPELAQQYKVMTLPTTVVLDEAGRAVSVNYGLAAKPKLQTQLAALIQPGHFQATVNELQHAA